MDKLRVVHSRAVWLAVTQNWLFNQIKYLDESIERYVVCAREENLDQFHVENIHRLRPPSLFERYVESAARRLGVHTYHRPFLSELKKIDAHILHSHFGHQAWSEMAAARKAGIKQVVTFYGHDVNRLPCAQPVWRERYQALFKYVTLVLCEGTHMANCIVDLGCPREKVKVHHLGVDVDGLGYKPRSWERGQKLRVLIAGAFREKKGIPYALEALGRLRDTVPLEATIVGDADAEPRSQQEKSRILDVIKRFKLESVVRRLGFQPHGRLLAEAYSHHVFLSPSVTASDGDTEGGAPVGIIEMAATGMPVVATTHCDIPEVIQDGQTGLLAQERDVEGLGGKIVWLLDNPEKWKGLTDRARGHVEKEYNAKIQGKRLSRIYTEILG